MRSLVLCQKSMKFYPLKPMFKNKSISSFDDIKHCIYKKRIKYILFWDYWYRLRVLYAIMITSKKENLMTVYTLCNTLQGYTG